MITVPPPVSTAQALGMLRSAMSYLAAADATAMAAETQAQCLHTLERINSMGTAARASILGAFTAGQGYCADADYSVRAWLIHKTKVTKGAAVAYTAWVRRAVAHPQVAEVLAAGQMSRNTAMAVITMANVIASRAWPSFLRTDCVCHLDHSFGDAGSRAAMTLCPHPGRIR